MDAGSKDGVLVVQCGGTIDKDYPSVRPPPYPFITI